MSESSESFHIRTADPKATAGRLREKKCAGLIFGPANGWLTFVPYAELEPFQQLRMSGGFARHLSQALSATVLHYFYSEDYGWGFVLAREGAPDCKFVHWWLPKNVVERDGFDALALKPFAPPELIEALVENSGHAGDGEGPSAYRFAKLLGVPEYDWLSPDLVQSSTDEFVARGGKKIGAKPKSEASRIKLPASRKLAYPRSDLSAKEALAIVRPFMTEYESAWPLARIAGVGLNNEGRLENGEWVFTYCVAGSKMYIQVSLTHYGHLSFRSEGMGVPRRSCVPLATSEQLNWLDSFEIANIVGQQELPSEIDLALSSLSMDLEQDPTLPPIWRARRYSSRQDPNDHLATMEWFINALSGHVAIESFRVHSGDALAPVIRSRYRRRTKDGGWEEVDLD
jgi:hypothetical protein